MSIHSIFTRRFWLMALSLVTLVIQPVYAALTSPSELEALFLPTNREEGSVIKVEKYLPDTVRANETITYTIKVTNKTANRILLDVVVYEILPSEEEFEYTGASPSPIISRPIAFRDLDKPRAQGGTPLNSRVLTFRWDDDRIFYPGEERTIAVTGVVKKKSADLKTLLAPRFCTAANYVTGFCKGVTTAELKLIKQFERFVVDRNGNFVVDRTGNKVTEKVPDGGTVPKYPKLCEKMKIDKPLEYARACAKHPKLCETAKNASCAEAQCIDCEPKNPELCTFGVKIWAQNTGTEAISEIRLTDDLANPLVIHNSGMDRIGPKSLSPITLRPGSTSNPETRQLRAECSANDVGTPAQAESANPVLKVESNTPKINITSSDLVVSARAPTLETGTRIIPWAIRVENKGERAAQNVDVVANFSSRGVGYTLIAEGGVRSDTSVTWKLPQLEPFGSQTFNVEQKLAEARGSATVEVTATSNCDCDKVVAEASSINYAMVVEMIDLNDPFRPQVFKSEDTIRYRLTVCNQVRNENSAFDFEFSGGLYGPYLGTDSPAKEAVNSYFVKFNKIARLNDDEEVEGVVPLDSHYLGVAKEETFRGWEWDRKFQFGSKLKGRHCAKFDIGVQVNDSLANGKHSLRINVNTIQEYGVPLLEAKETEPTTVEK